ncbi:MAG: type II toxin-antitoxin system VapC family toxin [Actinobacteria bacterium]|nr:type II toxin-antitoxin system VapC family toxin [Actinomycetota bacterium]
MPLVVDASAALSWAFADESSSQTDRVLDAVITGGALVPALWHVEIANALVMAHRSGRISAADRSQILRDLSDLDIRTDVHVPVPERLCWAADTYRLSAYDASYLVLALDRGVALATSDRELRSAARKAGVTLV